MKHWNFELFSRREITTTCEWRFVICFQPITYALEFHDVHTPAWRYLQQQPTLPCRLNCPPSVWSPQSGPHAVTHTVSRASANAVLLNKAFYAHARNRPAAPWAPQSSPLPTLVLKLGISALPHYTRSQPTRTPFFGSETIIIKNIGQCFHICRHDSVCPLGIES